MPVIRHDTPDERHLVDRGAFPMLVDMPDMGHGVLIADDWAVTAAHAIWDDVDETGSLDRVSWCGEPLSVAEVRIHPGFRPIPADWERLGSERANAFQLARDDIALIRLSAPIEGMAPAPLYRASDEVGKIEQIVGKGMTGDGVRGLDSGSPYRGSLRRVENRIETAEGPWLSYTFDAPPSALPLEGMHGAGDSGGPGFIEQDGAWRLAGLTAWTWASGTRSEFRPGLYGQRAFQARISHYVPWIEGIVSRTAR